MNYWYASQPDEIFLDLDTRNALLRTMKILRAGIKSQDLPVRDVWHYPTGRRGHSHVIVKLFHAISPMERALWALWMGSDRLRFCYVYSRIGIGLGRTGDLLMSGTRYHRDPDATCQCYTGKKHKGEQQTMRCSALKHLLGQYRSVDFFPRAGRKRVKPLRIPIGRVPLTLIRKWKDEKIAEQQRLF